MADIEHAIQIAAMPENDLSAGRYRERICAVVGSGHIRAGGGVELAFFNRATDAGSKVETLLISPTLRPGGFAKLAKNGPGPTLSSGWRRVVPPHFCASLTADGNL